MPAIAQPAIPEIRVVGRALSPAANEPLFESTALSRTDLSRAAGLRLDDALRTVPGFGLFRRQSSRAAHPTTQGVTLRGLGPSGAGRTLVLLDGVPQNDAFGGWIDWSRLPAGLINNATITRGGGAGAWGNAALAGVIRLDGRAPDPGRGWIDARGGTDATYSGAAAGSLAVGGAAATASLFGHDTGGGFLIGRSQRGPVDRRTANRGGGGALVVTGAVDQATRVTVRAGYSEDRLTNGLDLARSRARVADASASLVNDAGPDATSWQVNAYVRDQAFRAVFAGVNAARTVATPALDQFAVPASAVGANLIVRRPVSPALTLDLGGDVRHADGTTNERFQFVGQGFTRRREAGGEQTLAGGFAEATWTPAPDLLLTAGGRIDAWRQHDGRRRETDIATGATLRDDRFAATDGVVGNVRAGARAEFAGGWAVRAVAYSGFRVPTLNELYRPFRVGNDITEANPALTPERLYGGDLGVDG
ncbi:MAG: TonB-dependent receptor, partial [Rhodospirillaceae bacterium]|nr:TonB-dependent receptor [Rhodospirillaceae bacterium]